MDEKLKELCRSYFNRLKNNIQVTLRFHHADCCSRMLKNGLAGDRADLRWGALHGLSTRQLGPCSHSGA